MGLSDLTIKEALVQIKQGSLSPEELCKKCNRRRNKTKSLNLYVAEIPEDEILRRSRESQRFIDKGNPRSLEGIPIGFKNNYFIQGMPATCASRLLLDFKPCYSATMVTRCLDSGALLDGIHNMDEFAMGSTSLTSCHGPSKNPWTFVVKPSPKAAEVSLEKSVFKSPSCDGWNHEDFYLPGGSSGASAAAVAAGTCLAAFGSDTGGSVRMPAALCGVVGLKPTYGLLSRHGLTPLIGALDCPGIFTKTVEDCAIVLNSVLGHDLNDPVTSRDNPSRCELNPDLQLSDIHIGIPTKEYTLSSTSEEIATLWQDMADMLAKAGAKVSQVSVPHTPQSSKCYNVLCSCEIATTFSKFYGKDFGGHEKREQPAGDSFAEINLQDFNEEARKRLQSGMDMLRRSDYKEIYAKAQRDKQEIAKDFKTLFDRGVDLLLTPITSTEAPLKSWFLNEENRENHDEQFGLTIPANLAGIPAISLPLRLSRNGLPLSLQLVGRWFEESKLLSVAHWLEQSAKFPRLSLDFLDEEKD